MTYAAPPEYIDALCRHIAEVQDRYERSSVFGSAAGADLHVKLTIAGEVSGLRRALALALGLDPDRDSGEEDAADTYFREWKERA
jgi:hypothetical protein